MSVPQARHHLPLFHLCRRQLRTATLATAGMIQLDGGFFIGFIVQIRLMIVIFMQRLDQYDQMIMTLPLVWIGHCFLLKIKTFHNHATVSSSDGGNEKNFPLPPDWAAPRQSLPPSPSFQVGRDWSMTLRAKQI